MGAPKNGKERRRHERLPTSTAISCALGELIDMTGTGMRVACKRKPPVSVGQSMSLSISTEVNKIKVDGRIIWVRRTGFRSFQIGIKFDGVKPVTAKALESIAKFGYIDQTVLRKSDDSKSKSKSKSEAKSTGGRSKQRTLPPSTPRVEARFPDYYEILGVEENATPDDIKTAFRNLARKHHPDVCDDEGAKSKFQEIHHAYKTLIDPDKRKAYDYGISASKPS